MIDETIEDPDPRARRDLLEALALAFRDNPMNLAIHGSHPKRRIRANRAGLRALVLDTADETMTRVIRWGGRVAGGFVVVPPGVFPITGPSLARQIACLIGQGSRAMQGWSTVTAFLGQHHPSEPHWYLAVLGVDPTLRGRGLGGRLLDELGRLVKRDPRPLYLESDREASVQFYRRRGFKVRDRTTIHGVQCWCLGRGFGGDVSEFPDRVGESADLCDSVREC